MKTLGIIAIALLAGCATAPREQAPGSLVKVRWQQYENQLDVVKACADTAPDPLTASYRFSVRGFGRNGGRLSTDTAGCFRWEGDTCVIITQSFTLKEGKRSELVDADAGKMMTAGHELRHCYAGYFHVEDD